jgi:hypothetical protein
MFTYCISSCRHPIARIELQLINEIDGFADQNARHPCIQTELIIFFVVLPSENPDTFL